MLISLWGFYWDNQTVHLAWAAKSSHYGYWAERYATFPIPILSAMSIHNSYTGSYKTEQVFTKKHPLSNTAGTNWQSSSLTTTTAQHNHRNTTKLSVDFFFFQQATNFNTFIDSNQDVFSLPFFWFAIKLFRINHIYKNTSYCWGGKTAMVYPKVTGL